MEKEKTEFTQSSAQSHPLSMQYFKQETYYLVLHLICGIIQTSIKQTLSSNK